MNFCLGSPRKVEWDEEDMEENDVEDELALVLTDTDALADMD